MNKGFLIIAIPAFLVSIFWLTIGWGWHVAVIGGCLELAIAAVGITYAVRRQAHAENSAQNSGPGGPAAGA